MKVKMCGLYRPEDIDYANEVQPDYVGFVFYPKSHRVVTKEQARAYREALNPSIRTVGVFVNEDPKTIIELLEEGILDVAQLHGDETEEDIQYLQAVCGKPVIKAVKVRDRYDVEAWLDSSADYLLFDNGMGTGQAFDWSVLGGIDREFFLAGGLQSENLTEAMEVVRPYALDISSGIESNRKKIRRRCAGSWTGRTVSEQYRLKIQNKRRIKNQEERREDKHMSKGRYGIHGGQYISETLMNELIHLEECYEHYKKDPEFNAELNKLLNEYAGRPSLLYYAGKMTKDLGGAKIYLKREDLNHTGSHKINNALGQALLAKKMGKTRLIAETGAGQHGVATATAAAFLGMECEIFMGKEDTNRQALNVYRMELLGAKVHPVTSGTMTLKDAVNETMREWSNRVEDTHYVLGSVMGPHPFPMIVRDFQSVISQEAKEQILKAEGKLPAAVVACVGGGSNAMGAFYNFIDDKDVELIGCEAAGKGVDTALTAATIATGSLGIFHGMKSYFCQDEYGQIAPVYSISAGLDYPGIGPEHAYLHDIGRAQYVPITDDEAVDAFEYLARTEGIICAIESAHAVAQVRKIAKNYSPDLSIIICLSGRGDKDVAAIARYRGVDIHD